MSRRGFLAGMAALGTAAAQTTTSRVDELLDDVARSACLYFDEHAHPETGLVRDRARARGRETRHVASIAATGFGLSALCVGDERGYLPRGVARQRVRRCLEFLASGLPHEHGFFYHFVDAGTGKRVWRSELSSIDTAWLLCGVLHAQAHLNTPSIDRLADEIVGRVNWRWMCNHGDTLAHGWTPEDGFLPWRWDAYAEHTAMYLLAIGSATHPLPPSHWESWSRPRRRYAEISYIDDGTPLFVHQYAHAWVDFRNRRDRHADYFANSQLATIAHRRYCADLGARFPWYAEGLWGVTASDSRQGYRAWGGPGTAVTPDGTVVPCAAGGSIAFLPEECGAALQAMRERHGKAIWGRYGFVDAFHPGAGWTSPDVLGIDLGIMLLMAENHRHGSVWRAMERVPELQRGMRAVGLAG